MSLGAVLLLEPPLPLQSETPAITESELQPDENGDKGIPEDDDDGFDVEDDDQPALGGHL